MNNIYCDKCGSYGVKEYSKDIPKEPEGKSMDEYIRNTTGPQMMNAILIYHTFVLECPNCGYRKEFQR